MTDLLDLDMREAARRIASGKLTAETLLRAYLDRSAAMEPTVGAWQHLDPERALAEARARDKSAAKGALHGIPVGIKDVIDTADMPTTYGSAAYAGFRPAADAACVALLRAAGGIVMGKTVSTEFAAISPGKTRNPHNLAHTPGGSSSGSAAGVAARMVPLALGTQTAGSVIRPSAFCGVVGYKPTLGMIDRTGVKTLAASLDTVGLIGRNVRDVAFLAAALSERPGLVPPDEVPTPRIGVYHSAIWDQATDAGRAAIERAAAAAARAGATVSMRAVPAGHDELLAYHDAVMGWDMSQALAFERLNRADKITPKTREMLIERNERRTLDAYLAAQAGATALRARLDELFGDCDAVITPPAPGEAPKGLDSTGDASFNRSWTLLNVPCVTVPAGTGPAGLPLGVQIVGRIGQDARTLAVAAFVEQALAA